MLLGSADQGYQDPEPYSSWWPHPAAWTSNDRKYSIYCYYEPPFSSMWVSYEIEPWAYKGTGYTAPVFNYIDPYGTPQTDELDTFPTEIEVAPGSSWSVTPNPLTGSTDVERWNSNDQLSGTAGTAGSSEYLFSRIIINIKSWLFLILILQI